MFFDFQTNFITIISTFDIIGTVIKTVILVCFIVRGLAYKKLQGKYFGFFPYVGELVCMMIIANKYKSKSRVAYLVFSIIALPFRNFFIQFMMAMNFITNIIFKAGVKDDIVNAIKNEGPRFFKSFSYYGRIFMYFLIVILVISLVVTIIIIISRYNILRPLMEDIIYSDTVGFYTFIFSIFPFIFHLWILFNNSLKDWDEI